MKKWLIACLLLLNSNVSSFGESWPCGSCGANWMNITDWYIAAGASIDWHRDLVILGGSTNEEFDFKPGWNAFGALGAIVFYQWRVEFELAYHLSKIKNVQSSIAGTSATISVGGHIEDTPLMVNAYYDIPVMEFVGLYIGAGVGVSFNEFHASGYTNNGANVLKITKKEALFAWQFKAGLMVHVSCHGTFFAGYRFFGTGKPAGDFTRNTSNGNFDASFSRTPYLNALEVGIRIKI